MAIFGKCGFFWKCRFFLAKSGYFMGLMDIFGKKWTFVWKSGYFWKKWIFFDNLTCPSLIYFRLIFVFGMLNRTFGKWSRAKSKVSWIQFLVSAIVILVLLIKYLMRKR